MRCTERLSGRTATIGGVSTPVFKDKIILFDDPPSVDSVGFESIVVIPSNGTSLLGWTLNSVSYPSLSSAREDFVIARFPFNPYDIIGGDRELNIAKAAFVSPSYHQGGLNYSYGDVIYAESQVQIGTWVNYSVFACDEAHTAGGTIDYSKWSDVTATIIGYIENPSTLPSPIYEPYSGEGNMGGWAFSRWYEFQSEIGFTATRTSGFQSILIYSDPADSAGEVMAMTYPTPNASSPTALHPDTVSGVIDPTYCGYRITN